ncbi:uncharacterized protein [Musca autumnalis]|uniref:uncharacterized protein n=1 Tax=Musca autumnalis TaxID=221902 RepID=UPI003CF673ED
MAGFVIKSENPNLDANHPPPREDKKQLHYRLRQDNRTQQRQEQSSSKTKKNLSNGPVVHESRNHCGEIFVTSNAKKWTFVCTYCQKSTRDIGEFVCHIKFKHMGGSQYFDEDDDGEDVSVDEQKEQHVTAEDSYNQGQDYFDCANYLDVNVHIEDSDEQQSSSKKANFKTHRNGGGAGGEVVNLLDDEEEEGEEEDDDANNTTAQFEYEHIEDDEHAILLDEPDNFQQMGGAADSNKEFLLQSMAHNDNDSINDDLGSTTSRGRGKKRNRPHVKGSFHCKLCEKTFQYFSLYRNHMIKHSNFTPFKCEFCSKGFKSKQAIRYHMKTHSKEREFQCPICPSNFATSSVFISHVLTHESETCYPCMVCAKILGTEEERELHVETHSQERPYGCTFCSKRFRQKHHLSNHLKLHCRYRCDFCKESFNSTQSQRRPYACPTCEDNPDIREQVERQRSLGLRTSTDIAPMEFENVLLENPRVSATECVDLDEVPSDDNDDDGGGDNENNDNGQNDNDESDDEEGNLLVRKTKYPQCRYCSKEFAHIGALNFHIQKAHAR